MKHLSSSDPQIEFLIVVVNEFKKKEIYGAVEQQDAKY
jgi:hypothetical protein